MNEEELIVKAKMVLISIFLFSFFSLIISLKLFWNVEIIVNEFFLGLFWNVKIFVDEFFLGLYIIVDGREFYLTTDWITLFLLFLVCILRGLNVFRKLEE